MRKLIYSMMVSVDGFIDGPNQDLSWHVIDEELHSFANQQARSIDTALYGRRLYQLMNEFWPTADADPSYPPYVVEYAQIWKSTPILVFSKTLDAVTGHARLVKGDAVETVRQLKAQPGKDISLGGATLAATFIPTGLIDEYHLYIHPSVVGRGGTRMFPALDQKLPLELIETHRFTSGVVYLRYRSATAG
jgi:dihydrofolate reductase